MAVLSLRYRPDKDFKEDSKGFIVFDGKPAEFFDWEFRISIQSEILKTETDKGKRVKIISKIIEGLRGDALQTAKDLGVPALILDDGIENLMKNMTGIVFPQKKLRSEGTL